MLKTTIVMRLAEAGVRAVVAAALLPVGGCGDAQPKCLEVGASSDSESACGAGDNGGTSGAGASGGSGMPITVNGCDATTAIDKSKDAMSTIMFEGIEYTPRCVRVRAGSQVVFSGDFASHPLVGGTVESGIGTPDPSSPLPATSSGSEMIVTMSKIGAVPYYCTAHTSSGMKGAIFVE